MQKMCTGLNQWSFNCNYSASPKPVG